MRLQRRPAGASRRGRRRKSGRRGRPATVRQRSQGESKAFEKAGENAGNGNDEQMEQLIRKIVPLDSPSTALQKWTLFFEPLMAMRKCTIAQMR